MDGRGLLKAGEWMARGGAGLTSLRLGVLVGVLEALWTEVRCHKS